MRKTLFALLICFFGSTTMPTNCFAQSKLIHYWNFNSLPTTTLSTPAITAIPADYTDLAGANARILYTTLPGTSAAYSSSIDEGFLSSSGDYDTINLLMGAGSGYYIRLHNPSDSMELLFYTPSTHFNNLVLTFGTSRPTNGMKYQDYDYSIDSGANWITTGLSMLTDSVWSVFQRITLTTTNTAANNNPKLVFRVTFTGSNTGTMGNNRFDNVSLNGDTILTAPSAINTPVADAGHFTLYPNPAGNTLGVNTAMDGAKRIVITNAAGQKVYERTEGAKQFSIDIAALKAGNYFISINENTTGKTGTMQFLKE